MSDSAAGTSSEDQVAKWAKEEKEIQEYRTAKQREWAEQWAKLIRVKDELIRWPFTRDIVKGAVRHFGAHHRPLLPYALREDEYDQIIVAEATSDGYIFCDADDSYDIPEVSTWREWAEWEGAGLEEFAELHGVEEDEWDNPIGDGVLEESLGIHDTPRGRACSMLADVFYPPATVELPIGQFGLVYDNAIYAEIEPKVALTFLQILLDHEGSGIRIVLEDDWLREKKAVKGD